MLRNAGFWTSLVVLALALTTLVIEPRETAALRNLAFDSYQRWQPRPYRDVGVKILDIDDESLSRLGQWPWPRARMAEIVERLFEAGAKVVAFDVIFAEPDRHSPEAMLAPWAERPAVAELIEGLTDPDRQFAEALAGRRVVIGFALADAPGINGAPDRKAGVATAGGDPRPFLPTAAGAVVSLPMFQRAVAGNAALHFTGDAGGVIRRIPVLVRIGDEIHPTLMSEALRLAAGAKSYFVKSAGASGADRFGEETGILSVKTGPFVIPTDPTGQLWLHYSEPSTARYLPAWRLLAGKVEKDTLKDGIVFVGTSAAGLKDLRFTPFGFAAGVEVHAQAVEQVLEGSFLIRPDWASAAEALFLLGLWILLLVMLSYLGAIWSAVIAILVGGAAVFASWHAFSAYGLLVDPVLPALATVALYLACSLPRHIQSERQQRWIRQAFSSYISPNLVQHLIDHPDALSLGGERRECSFVLTDLAGFTAMVEGSEPDAVVEVLNDYLDGMVKIALAHEGTLDRIIGDAVAVMFSAPVQQDDHAARAVACALEMDTFASDFAAERQQRGLPLGRTRIGVNTGLVTIGNVGGKSLFDYRALGDAVNTASRLENANRQLGTNICVAASTVAGCPQFQGRPIGTLMLVGKREAVPTFEPLPPARMQAPETDAYLEAFGLLEASDPGAQEAFRALGRQCPDDPLVRFHLERLEAGEHGATIVFASK
jgi:adenylate cyclase